MDDSALIPGEPTGEPQENEQVALQEGNIEDQRRSRAYFHPAWESVQDDIEETVDMLKDFSGVDTNLLAVEFKIECMSRVKAANQLTNLLDRIKQSVEAVERAGTKPSGDK